MSPITKINLHVKSIGIMVLPKIATENISGYSSGKQSALGDG